jgi:5-methylcytosine-specific restriction endonuclease McrA
VFDTKHERRRDYYLNVYLKSDNWKRKRYVVLKRDKWRCVYCGAPATQVYHKRYAKKNIGKEPIEWLVSICRPCHESIHNRANNKMVFRSKNIRQAYRKLIRYK